MAFVMVLLNAIGDFITGSGDNITGNGDPITS